MKVFYIIEDYGRSEQRSFGGDAEIRRIFKASSYDFFIWMFEEKVTEEHLKQAADKKYTIKRGKIYG